MKNLFVLTIALFGASVIFSSCKKDYDCVCTVNGTKQAAVTYKDSKKSDAKDACETLNTSAKNAAAITGGSASCELD